MNTDTSTITNINNINNIELYNLIRNHKPNIKHSTINAYINVLTKLHKELYKTDYINSLVYINVSNLTDYINTYTNIATKKNIYTAILVLLRALQSIESRFTDDLIKIYSDAHTNLANIQRENYGSNEKTSKELDNWLTLNDIDIKKKELESQINLNDLSRKMLDKIQQHLVVSLYTEIPPLRNDYAKVIVKKEIPRIYENGKSKPSLVGLPCNINYIDMTNKVLILCDYKTNLKYGIKEIQLNDHIIDIIRRWGQIRKKIIELLLPGKTFDLRCLLINVTDFKPMITNGLTKYLNKIFKPLKVSTTLLRKIYLSEKYPVINTFDEMEKDSYIMGHSITTQQQIYRKKN
jgi:hypothetical protein